MMKYVRRVKPEGVPDLRYYTKCHGDQRFFGQQISLLRDVAIGEVALGVQLPRLHNGNNAHGRSSLLQVDHFVCFGENGLLRLLKIDPKKI